MTIHTHTPTPWDLHDGISITLHNNNQHIIAISKGGLTGKLDEAEANAAFIVRACNAHEKSIETLKELETDCLHLMQAAGVPNEKITKPYANSMLGRIQAALKLARGE